jgi:hypothetical protein
MNNMLFLLQYHRRAGKLVHLERFATSQRMDASQAMLDLEIELRHGQQRVPLAAAAVNVRSDLRNINHGVRNKARSCKLPRAA